MNQAPEPTAGDFLDQVEDVRKVVPFAQFAAQGQVANDVWRIAARQDACESMGGTHFPEYVDFIELLDDLIPVASVCAQRGGTLCWPAWADRRKRRNLHLIWVAKVAKIRLRDVKRLLKRTKRPGR